MRRLLLSPFAALMLAAPASAAVSYEHGLYSAGTTKGTGVSMEIGDGRFEVRRISFMERCRSDRRSFEQRVTFVRGSEASLDGSINRRGRFRGRYASGGTVFKVEGRVEGRTARLVATDRGSYEKAGEGTVRCQGSHRFKARYVDVTGSSSLSVR